MSAPKAGGSAPGGRVVVVGSANVDYVVRVPDLPGPGETVIGGDLRRFPGGKGANQAVAAARLGADVTFVGRLGDDEAGGSTVEGLEGEGVATHRVARDPNAPTGAALIVVDAAGENAIAVAPGANARLSPADVEAATREVRDADVLLLQLETPLDSSERAIAIAREADTTVVLNPAPAAAFDARLLSRVDVLTPNLGEARTIVEALGGRDREPGDLARALLAAGVGRVAVTLGGEGALLARRGEIERLPAVPAEAVDTTAAGDAFSGALAVALARGLGWAAAGRFASRAASLAVAREGARPSLPTLDELSGDPDG